MRIREFITKCALVFSLAVGIPLVTISEAGASTHSCVSNWCSGSDTNTSSNSKGNSPQIYLGEVGVYYSDPYITGSTSHPGPCTKTGTNVDGSCFNATGALNANLRAAAGTGVGTQYFYLLGGPNSTYEPKYGSPYCFGWAQGNYAVYYGSSTSYFGDYWDYAVQIYADIEQNAAFGWYGGSSVTASQMSMNRKVINGFEDYVAGQDSTDSLCSGTNGLPFQYGVYSAPYQWSFMFGSVAGGTYGVLAHTFIWTYESQLSTDVDPGSFSSAQWFASSSSNVGYQFYQGPDHDLFYEPQYMPVFGTTWGT